MPPPYQPWPTYGSGWCLLDSASRPTPATVPNGLQPGDVLLYCPRSPDLIQSGIAQAQEYVFGQQDGQFTHVAIYDGAGRVYDATPNSHVALRPLHQMHIDGWLRARRLTGVSAAEQADICAEAAGIAASRARYSRAQAFAHGLLAASATLAPRWQQLFTALVLATHGNQDQVFYCSGFVQRVHNNTVGFGAWHPYMVAPLPASFSVTANWSEVSLSW